MDATFFSEILVDTAFLISGLFNRKLTELEKQDIYNFVNENIKYLDNPNANLLAERYMKFFKTTAHENNDVVFHKIVNINNIFGMKDLNSLILDINPKLLTKKAYVCLDSRYGKLSDDRKSMTWSVENSLIESYNSTNVLNKIRNIKSMQLHTACVSNSNNAFILGKRYSLLINELAAQSFTFPNGRKCHFIGSAKHINNYPDDNMITIDADPTSQYLPDYMTFHKYQLSVDHGFNDGVYKFNKPITHLDNITVSIGSPVDLITLRNDRFSNVNINFILGILPNEIPYSPSLYDTPPGDVAVTVVLTFSIPHGFNTANTWREQEFTMFIDGFLVDGYPVISNLINNTEHTVYEVIDEYVIYIQLGYYKLRYGKYDTPFYINIPGGEEVSAYIPQDNYNANVTFNGIRSLINMHFEYLQEE